MASGIGDRPWTQEDALRNTRARFEQWAHNPACTANAMSAVHNLRMDRVAKQEGLPITFGASPFALARGETFERDLFDNKASRLLDALIERGVVPQGSDGFRDYRLKMNGGSDVKTIKEALEETAGLLREIAGATTDRKRTKLPTVVAAPTVRIPRRVILPEAILIIDALVVRRDLFRPRLVVGEIKTYPDHGGHTDGHRARAGTGAGGPLRTRPRPGGGGTRHRRQGRGRLRRVPRSHPTGVELGGRSAQRGPRFQAERAKRGFDLLEDAAAALPPVEGEPPTAEDVFQAVIGSKTSYSESCLQLLRSGTKMLPRGVRGRGCGDPRRGRPPFSRRDVPASIRGASRRGSPCQ